MNVGLFQGMSDKEVSLLAEPRKIKNLKADEVLFEEGDAGKEMYSILEGGVDIYLDEKKHKKKIPLTRFEKGVAFGEMGLFRHCERAASAAASGETKLLVLTEDVLLDFEKQNPAGAAKLFLNLARNLAEIVSRSNRKLADKTLQTNRVDAFFKEPLKSKTIKDLVHEFIEDGFLSNAERMELDRTIYADHKVDAEEQAQLDRLQELLSQGTIKEEAPIFTNMFKGINERQMNWLRNSCVIKELKSGDEVFSQGDSADSLVIGLKGKFQMRMENGGKSVTVATIMEGEPFGELAFLCGVRERRTTVVSIEDARILLCNKSSYSRILKKNRKLAARFAFNLVCRLSSRLEDINGQLYD